MMRDQVCTLAGCELRVSPRALMRLLAVGALPACAWITPADYAHREDPDGDGVLGVTLSDPDCAPNDPTLPRDWYADADGDGYGLADAPSSACERPEGYADLVGDCDDARPDVHPGAQEVCDDDDADEDCDALADDADPDVDLATARAWARDADGDGFGDPDDTTAACDPPAGYLADATDCADADPAVHPGATEVCADGWDNDCDAATNAECRHVGTAPATAAGARLFPDPDAYADIQDPWFGATLAWIPADGPDAIAVGTGGWPNVPDSVSLFFVAPTTVPGDNELGGDVGFAAYASTPWDGATSTRVTDGSGLVATLAHPLLVTTSPVVTVDGDDSQTGQVFLLDADLSRTSDWDYSGAIPLFVARSRDMAPTDGVAFGDLDADGYPDVVVSTSNRGSRDEGAVYLLAGQDGGPAPAEATTLGSFISGDEDYGHLGGRPAIGDFDGDGFDDLAVGVPGHVGTRGDASAAEAGIVYVYLGSTTFTSGTYDHPSEQAVLLLLGEEDGERLTDGGALASGFDYDEDGIVDLMVGGPGPDPESALTVLPRGRACLLSMEVALTPHPDFGTVTAMRDVGMCIEGDEAGGRFGSAVSGAGDVDGDGHPDVVVGSDRRTADDDRAGAAWVYYGPLPSTGTYDADSVELASWRFDGGDRDGLGGAVSGGGDFDDDGFGDLLLGAPTPLDGIGFVLLVSGSGV